VSQIKKAASNTQPSNQDNSILTNIDHEQNNKNGFSIFTLGPQKESGKAQAEKFLTALYGNTTKGFLTLWTSENKETRCFPTNDIQGFVKEALNLRNTKNVYFGVGLRTRKIGKHERGKKEDVLSLPGVWLDIDIKGGAHKKENIPTEEDAQLLLDTFPLSPTIIIHSGGGLHCYWLFEDPATITSDETRKSAERMLSRFQNVFIRLARTKNLHLDNTADLPRVLRVPGTFNRKEEAKPVQTLLFETDSRYSVHELYEAITFIESTLPEEPKVKTERKQYDGEIPDAKHPEKIVEGCQFIKEYLNHQETAIYDEWVTALSIAAYCENGADLVHEWSKGHPGYSEKESEEKYEEIRSNMKPRTCQYIQENFGACHGCQHFNKIHSPIALGMEKKPIQNVSSKEDGGVYSEWKKALAETGKYDVNRNGHLCSVKYNKDGEAELIPLANFLARPVREVVEDNGVETNSTFEIEGILAGGKPLPRVAIPADKFSSMTWVAAEWGMRANVEPGAQAKDKIRHAIQSLAQDIDREHIFTHLGWKEINNEWIYLHSNGAIGGEDYRVNLEKENMQKYALPENTEDLHNAIKLSLDTLNLAERSTTIPLLAMIGLAPLCEVLKQAGIEPAFVLWLVGESGSRKSTLVALYLNHFGNFPDGKSLPSSFKDTSNSIEKKAFITKDSLLVIDDYHPTASPIEAKKMEQLAQEILRGYGDRIGRTRMRPDGTLRKPYPPRGIAIVTAEDKPTAGTSTTARYFPIEMDRKSVNLSLLTQMQRDQWKLSHAMRGYIEWLKPQMDNLPGQLKEMFINVRDGQMDKERHGRINDSVSWLYIGILVYTNFAVETGVMNKDNQTRLLSEAYKVFNEVSEKQAIFMNDDKPAVLFITGLRELLATRVVYVNDTLDPEARKEGKMIGYCDNEYFYLHSQTAFEEVKKFYERQGLNFPVTAQTLFKHLEMENRILVKKEKSKTERTLTKKINGKNGRYLWLHKNALEIDDE
jgi:hypothetical protein